MTLKSRLLAAAGVAAVAGLAGFAGGWSWRAALCDAAANRTRVAELQGSVDRLEAERDELATVLNQHQEATRAAAERTRQARADAVAADRAADGLRQHVARLAAHCAPAADGSAAGADPSLVLPHMLDRVEADGRELAAALDRAHAAGQLCERAYDAVRGTGARP